MKSKRENQWSDQMMDSVISWFSEMSNNMLPVFSKFPSPAPALHLPLYPLCIGSASSGFSFLYGGKLNNLGNVKHGRTNNKGYARTKYNSNRTEYIKVTYTRVSHRIIKRWCSACASFVATVSLLDKWYQYIQFSFSPFITPRKVAFSKSILSIL